MTLAVVETDGLISAPQRKERLMSSNQLTNDLALLNGRETLKRLLRFVEIDGHRLALRIRRE